MDPGGVHGMDGPHAGDHAGDDRPGQLVDQGAEGRILLGRPAHRGERPDGTVAVVDPVDAEHGEVVGEAVIAEMVAERTLGLASIRIDGPRDDEVGLGRHGQATLGATIATRRPPSTPANASSGRPSGNGITAATVIAGGPPTNTFTRNGSPRRIAAA